MTKPYNPPTITNQRAQWKRIGEAADSVILYIERIDGFRITVTRHMKMSDLRPLPQTTVSDYENQARIQWNIIREAYRSAMEVADTKAAAELRERYLRAEDDLKRNEVRIKQESERLYHFHPSRSPFSW
jgi:hypothetical protein